jgi:hypothetical protein
MFSEIIFYSKNFRALIIGCDGFNNRKEAIKLMIERYEKYFYHKNKKYFVYPIESQEHKLAIESSRKTGGVNVDDYGFGYDKTVCVLAVKIYE